MKTWKDIKEGDTIYYYDHGKIHDQKVHSVELKTETHTHNYGYTITTSTSEWIEITAGRGSKIRINPWYYDNDTYDAYYFKRFTTKEALIRCIKERKAKYQKRYDKYKKQVDRMVNAIIKYNDVILQYDEILNNQN